MCDLVQDAKRKNAHTAGVPSGSWLSHNLDLNFKIRQAELWHNCDISMNMHSFWGQVKWSNSCTKRKQEKDVGTKLLDWYWLKLEIYLQTICPNSANNQGIELHSYLYVFNRICLQLETARFSRACGRSLDKHEKATWRSKETTAASIWSHSRF